MERKRTSNLKQLLLYSDRNVVVALNPECVHLFTDSSPRVSTDPLSLTHSFPAAGDHAVPHL